MTPQMRVAAGTCVWLLTAALMLPAVAGAQPSFSLGLGIGATQFDADERGIAREFPDLQPDFDIDESATSFRLFGSWLFDPRLALDLDLLYLGDLIAEDANGRDRLFSVGGVTTAVRLQHRFNDRLKGFARLGGFLWTSSTSADDNIDEGFDITYGAGVDISIHNEFKRALRLEWNRFDFNGVTLDAADTFTASLVFDL